MASGGTLGPKVMTLEDKDGTVQKMAFSAALEKSSTEKAWNDHEERLAQHFQSIMDLDNDFEELKQKEANDGFSEGVFEVHRCKPQVQQ